MPPEILSFGLNQESTLCLRSGMPYKPLYLKLKPKTETGSLNCAYNGGNYGACSDPSFADHCTFKTALDKCIVKITGKRVVPKSENDQLIKQPVLQSAVFDQYAPAYNVASTTTGVINLSDYHGMAIAADGENDIINETATLTGATSNATVTVNFTIDKQIKNTDQLVVLKFADKTQCTIIPQKQPNGTYGGECSIPLMPNRFGTAVIAATAPGYTIEPAAARIGSYFTISSHEYVSNSKDTCYLNAKNISVTSQFPATGTDQDHYLVFKPDTDGHSCTAGSQYIGISYPIIDESTGYITFSSDQAFKPYIGRAQINANATSQQAVLNMSLIPVYNMTSGDNVTNYYLRLNALSQVDLIALMDKSANKFTDFYHSSPLKPALMSGYVPLYPYGEYLKDGAQARYSNIIANIFCPSGGSHKCNRSLANQNMIQMLPNQSNIWQKVPLTGLTFNKNSFSFLKESNASPLFIYNNQLNLLLLENVDEGSGARLKLKLYQYDESSKKWTLNNRITSTYMILYKEDLVDSNGNPFNPQFRISPGFNGDFYFPFGNPDTSVGDGENIMRCNLYNNTCRRIFMRNYWRHPEVKGKKVIISNITPGINNTIWVDFNIPLTQGFGSKYLDSAFFKIPTDDGMNPVYPTIIEVPPIHAIKPTSERLYAPQVATDVYTNIEAPVTGSGKENC